MYRTLKNKGGYKIHQKSNDKLRQLYYPTMELYQYYVRAIENRMTESVSP